MTDKLASLQSAIMTYTMNLLEGIFFNCLIVFNLFIMKFV